MAKQSGLSVTTFTVAGADIRNDINDYSFTTPRAVQDITGIDKAAKETLLLLADFTITMKGIFNAAVSHAQFSTIPTSGSAARAIIITVGGTMTATANLTDYAITRAAGGELTWQVPGVLSNGTAPVWS